MVALLPWESGMAIATTGTAWASVHSLSRASAIRRVVMPVTTMTAAPATAAMPAMRSPRRDRTDAEESDTCISDRCGGFSRVYHAEHDRHEHECSNRGKD